MVVGCQVGFQRSFTIYTDHGGKCAFQLQVLDMFDVSVARAIVAGMEQVVIQTRSIRGQYIAWSMLVLKHARYKFTLN